MMKNRILLALCILLMTTSCVKSPIEGSLDSTVNGIYKITANALSEQTRVSIDGTSVKWKGDDCIQVAEIAENGNGFSRLLSFIIDPESISTDGKTANFLGPNLIKGKAYIAFHGDVSLIDNGSNAGMVSVSTTGGTQSENNPLCVDWFMISETTAIGDDTPSFFFSHKQSLLELEIKLQDDITDEVELNQIIIETPIETFVSHVIISNNGNVSIPDKNLSKSCTMNISGTAKISSTKSYVIKIPIYWNPSISSIDGDFNIAIRTSDGKQSTITHPAKPLIAGHLYSTKFAFPQPINSEAIFMIDSSDELWNEIFIKPDDFIIYRKQDESSSKISRISFVDIANKNNYVIICYDDNELPIKIILNDCIISIFNIRSNYFDISINYGEEVKYYYDLKILDKTKSRGYFNNIIDATKSIIDPIKEILDVIKNRIDVDSLFVKLVGVLRDIDDMNAIEVAGYLDELISSYNPDKLGRELASALNRDHTYNSNLKRYWTLANIGAGPAGDEYYFYELSGDICPAGYHVPADYELSRLNFSCYYWRYSNKKELNPNGVDGVWLGESQANADKATKYNDMGCLFFPEGLYWSNTELLRGDAGGVSVNYRGIQSCTLSRVNLPQKAKLRCVKKGWY